MPRSTARDTNLILHRLNYYNFVYTDPQFIRLIRDFKMFKTWPEIQGRLKKFKTNNKRGRAYEEIARSMIMTHPDFGRQYQAVFFGRYPADVKDKLNISDK